MISCIQFSLTKFTMKRETFAVRQASCFCPWLIYRLVTNPAFTQPYALLLDKGDHTDSRQISFDQLLCGSEWRSWSPTLRMSWVALFWRYSFGDEFRQKHRTPHARFWSERSPGTGIRAWCSTGTFSLEEQSTELFVLTFSWARPYVSMSSKTSKQPWLF